MLNYLLMELMLRPATAGGRAVYISMSRQRFSRGFGCGRARNAGSACAPRGHEGNARDFRRDGIVKVNECTDDLLGH